MVFDTKSGNIFTGSCSRKGIDEVWIHWFETRKRIIHKTSSFKQSLTLRFFDSNPDFEDGDILRESGGAEIVVRIFPVKCIVIETLDLSQAVAVAYEIGNRHLPLYFGDSGLFTPFEPPLYNYLVKAGYLVALAEKVLQNPLMTSVLPHVQRAENIQIAVKNKIT